MDKVKKEKTAVFKLGDVPIGAYAWRIACNLIYAHLRKKYSKAKEKNAQIVELPTTATEVELQHLAEQQSKVSYLKKTIYNDPLQDNLGFQNIAAPKDFGTRLFENENLVFVLLDKLAKEKPEYETLIRLRYYAELSYKEIAQTRVTAYQTEESCKSHTSRAILKLAEIARQNGLFNHLD